MEIKVKIEMPEGLDDIQKIQIAAEAQLQKNLTEWMEKVTASILKDMIEGTSKIKNPTGIIRDERKGGR